MKGYLCPIHGVLKVYFTYKVST